MPAKVLVIDPICKKGHVSFNANCVRRLKVQGCEVSFIGATGYLPESSALLCDQVLSFRTARLHTKSKILSRALILWNLLQIRRLVKLPQYDAIVFTDFEELSLYASRLPRSNMYCVCHGTVEHLHSRIKRACAKRIFRTATAVAFNSYIRSALEDFGVENVVVIPHGLPPRFMGSKAERVGNQPIPHHKRLIVVPSSGEIDLEFFQALLESGRFLSFLEQNELLLVARRGTFKCASGNVLLIDGYLSKEEYESLFLAAALVFIPYSRALQHRVSNVLFECFSNDVPVLVLYNEALFQFREHFAYDPFIRSEGDLIASITRFLSAPDSYSFKDLENLDAKFDLFGGSGGTVGSPN